MRNFPVSMDVDYRLDYAERWLRDGLSVLHPPFAAMQVTVDMTAALRRLEAFHEAGVHATPTHLLVQAVARTLAANPLLHQIVAGNKRRHPSRVDIALSVAGDTFVAPVVIIEDAASKTVPAIAAEIVERVPKVRETDQQMMRMLRWWGRLIPFGVLRRALLRRLHQNIGFRRKAAGTFQISTVAGDWAVTSTFAAVGVLSAGQVRSRVIAVDGQPAVRPVMSLTLSVDHGAWDGRASARFLAAVKAALESSQED